LLPWVVTYFDQVDGDGLNEPAAPFTPVKLTEDSNLGWGTE